MAVLTVGPFGFSLRMDMGFLINDVDLETTISIYLKMEACDSTLLPQVPRMNLNKKLGSSQILLW